MKMSMKMSMLIGLSLLGAGLAGMSMPAAGEGSVAGRWRGVLLRDGVKVPISVELTGGNANFLGRLFVDDMSAPIQSGRASLAAVHFEVPGEGVFEGSVAGDSMAGSVSGASGAGSFSLSRDSVSPFDDSVTSSGP